MSGSPPLRAGVQRARRGGTVVLVGVVGLVALALPPGALGATIAVTTTGDLVVSNDGVCSMREAVSSAKSNAPSGPVAGECPKGDSSGSDRIVLGAVPYVLNRPGAPEDLNDSGDLDISSDVTIAGAGAAATTIDGDLRDRVIDVLAP